MTAIQKYKRPDCEEILKNQNLWALSLSALESDTEFQSKRMKYSEDTFHSHFIEMKKSRMSLDLSFSHIVTDIYRQQQNVQQLYAQQTSMSNNNNRSDSINNQKYTDLLMTEPISPVNEDQNDNQDNHMNDALHQHNSQHNSQHHSQHHSQQQQYLNYQLLLSKQYEKYLSQLPAKQREYHELVLSATNSPLYQQINGPLLLAQQQKHLIQQQYQQQLKQQYSQLQNKNSQQNSGIKLIPTTKRSPTIETIQLNRHQMNTNAIISPKVRIFV
jgi:hypothetical protein